jgi:hypothetical protein
MIEDYFTSTANTYRLATTTGTDNEEFELNLEDIDCQIQPLDDAPSEDLEGSVGKDFLMFCGSNDIIEGDKVVSSGTEYLVRGVESYTLLGDSHMEIRLRKTM